MFKHKLIITAIALAITNPAHADLTTGLVAYYPFNGNANDASGNGNNGTVNGATLTADKNGNANSAYSFDGSNSITVPDNDLWTLGAQNFTIDIRVNFNQLRSRSPFIAHDGGGKWIFWYDESGHTTPPGPALRLHINGSNVGIVDTISYPWNPIVGQWYSVAITRSGNTYALYIDGVQVATSSDQSYTIPDVTAPLEIGSAEAYNFNGSIDDVRIYNRALTAAEIQQLYSGGNTHQLTVTKIGNGTVTSNPAGINCGATCSANFNANSNVVLTATAASGSAFTNWSGACTGTVKTCTVAMTAAKTATATFNNVAKPDFTIPVMTITPATPITNGTFTATITVKNQSTVAADGGQLRLWANQPTTTVCAATGGDKNVAAGTLAAGASKTFTITGLNAGTGDTKILRAFVDATCIRAESNETNNQSILRYRLAGRLPDLIITNIAITPASPAKNTVFNAAITLKNQGTNATSPNYLDVWTNQAAMQTCVASGTTWADVGVLAAGASTVINVTGLNAGATAGTKTLRAFVDSWCEIVESNETNNQMIKMYTVP